MRNSSFDGYIHICDWYATFCKLAGVSAYDDVGAKYGLPAVDSIDQWPLLSGAVVSGTTLRTGIHVSPVALIDGQWKLLTGSDPGNINQHTEPGVVPFNVYGVGYGLEAVMAYVVMTCIVVAYRVMAYTVMAYTVMAHMIMAYMIMAYIS